MNRSVVVLLGVLVVVGSAGFGAAARLAGEGRRWGLYAAMLVGFVVVWGLVAYVTLWPGHPRQSALLIPLAAGATLAANLGTGARVRPAYRPGRRPGSGSSDGMVVPTGMNC